MPLAPERTALLVIDVQQAFDELERSGVRRNNPQAIGNMARLLDAFRKAGMALFHVRHSSTEADSAFRPERSGYQPIEATRELPGEPVIVKHVNSAFIGTDLEKQLRERGLDTLVITGATTNHCVDTTTRMAGNLGFDARLVSDACFTFDRTGFGGRTETAQAIHDMSLSNLSGEFATIETTDSVLAALRRQAAA